MRKTKIVALLTGFAGLILLSQCITPQQSEGEKLYTQSCANCHMDDGRGLRNLIPPLANADYLETHRDELACIIHHGQQGKIVVNGVTYDQKMPGNEAFSDVDVLNILNYVQENFATNKKVFTIGEVTKSLEKCRH